jgi:hypothetical protein
MTDMLLLLLLLLLQSGWTVLHTAAQYGRLEVAKVLLGAGAELDAVELLVTHLLHPPCPAFSTARDALDVEWREAARNLILVCPQNTSHAVSKSLARQTSPYLGSLLLLRGKLVIFLQHVRSAEEGA